jgi:hypothetical protein
MALSSIELCNRAIARVGGNPIASFDDGSAESIVAGKEYEQKVAAALAAHRWRFAMELKSLGPPLAAVPADKWAYAFQLPADLLALHGITRLARPVPYAVYGDKVLADEDADLVAEYTFRQVEAKWPAYFVEAFVAELSSVFALALARDSSLSSALAGEAMRLHWPRARLADSQQQTTQALLAGRLTGARR